LLILKGADVNAVNAYGLTPMTLATIAKKKDVMELLFKQGGHK
jgi:ankyrin repeat protein